MYSELGQFIAYIFLIAAEVLAETMKASKDIKSIELLIVSLKSLNMRMTHAFIYNLMNGPSVGQCEVKVIIIQKHIYRIINFQIYRSDIF